MKKSSPSRSCQAHATSAAPGPVALAIVNDEFLLVTVNYEFINSRCAFVRVEKLACCAVGPIWKGLCASVDHH